MIEMNQLTLTDYQDIKQEIRNNMQNIVVSFVEIGFYLKQIRDGKMYLEDGYKDIWEFAAGEFKLDRTAASRFMHINDKYSIDGNSRYLQDQYQGFSKSTLTEMLSLPVEDYELIKPDTKIEDIRELKAAEREHQEEEKAQIEGQESLLSIMPDVIPEAEKPKKEETTITDVLRELFKPREMKVQLDSLVNMDPDSSEMRWWVGDFNQQGNRVEKIRGYFIFFYSLDEGLQIRNIPKQESNKYTYKDFYFMVRAAFGQETVRGTDVWNQAFGAEYEAEQQRLKEEEERKREEEQRKKELQKQREERQRAIKENQEKMASEEPEKEVSEQNKGKNAAELKEIKENSDSENNLKCSDCEYYYKENDAPGETVDCHYNSGEENGWNEIPPCERKGNVEIETETPEIVTETVEEENSVCDIAQNVENIKCDNNLEESGFNVHLPVKIGERMYQIKPLDESGRHYYIEYLFVRSYTVSENTISVVCTTERDEYVEYDLVDLESIDIYVKKTQADKKVRRLNGEEE